MLMPIGQMQWIVLELWIERQPTAFYGTDLHIHSVPLSQITIAIAIGGYRMIVSEILFVAPLIGVDIMPTGSILQSRGTVPVLAKCDGTPGITWGQFFLPNVMC